MSKVKETDICKEAISWLQGQHWEVYQEVPIGTYGGVVDIVAVRAGVIWFLEGKTNLGLSVIQQAHSSICCAHMVSVIVPVPVRSSATSDWARWLCSHFGIGVIRVGNPSYGVKEVEKPRFYRPKKETITRMLGHLHDKMKTGEYGEAGNNCGARYTPYMQTMSAIRWFLNQNGPSTLSEIMAHITHHYANDRSARSVIPKALQEWEDWAECRREGRLLIFSIKDK